MYEWSLCEYDKQGYSLASRLGVPKKSRSSEPKCNKLTIKHLHIYQKTKNAGNTKDKLTKAMKEIQF
jgi:hypothetical protein